MARKPKPQTVWDQLPTNLGPRQPQWKAHRARQWGSRALMLLVVLCLVGALGALWKAGLLNAPTETRAMPGARSELSPAAAIEQRLSSARTLLLQGETDRARAALSAAIIEYPDDQDLRVAYAETLLQSEQLPAAYEQFVAALSIGPRRPDLEFAAGTLAGRIGRPQLAMEHYSVAQAADPTNADYPLYLGQTQMSLGELGPAKANLVRACLLREDDPRPWGMLAEIALRENITDLALQHITRARALQPSEPAWKVIEARAHKRKGEAQQALKLLRSLSEKDRLTKPVIRLMAECHGMLREPDIAAALFAEAADMAPDDAELAYEAAVSLERIGDSARAGPYAERAVAGGVEGARELLDRINRRQ